MATINKTSNEGQQQQGGLQRREESGVSRQFGWDPLSLARELMGFDPFRSMFPFSTGERGFMPHFEVKETGNAIVFAADLPGVKEEDVDISLEGNRLTISGQRTEEREENERYYTYERSYGSFSRSFVLPDGIDTDNIRADMKDGVLRLTVPRAAQQQAKKISVKGGQAQMGEALGGTSSTKEAKH